MNFTMRNLSDSIENIRTRHIYDELETDNSKCNAKIAAFIIILQTR